MIKQRSPLRRFVVGRGLPNTAQAEEKLRYRRTLEIGYVISLVLMILFFRLSANLNIAAYLGARHELNFELIDLTEIPQTEPPPQLIMEEVVEVPPVVEEPTEADNLIEEIEAMLGENEEEASLNLASDGLDSYLTSDSPLASLSGPRLQFRRSRASGDGDFRLAGNVGSLEDFTGGGLDIGDSGMSTRKQFDNIESGLDLELTPDPVSAAGQARPEPPEESDPRLGITSGPARILSFSSSTIGTEDYKLWNKIVSELDRLNKGRYGSVAKQIKRQRGGFVLGLGYRDNSRHEIHWRNDGNVWIKVIGHSNLSNVAELRRALSGLLRLSLTPRE